MTLVTADPREDFIRPVARGDVETSVVQRPLSLWQRLGNVGTLRKAFIVLVLALIWEGYARWLDNELLFPTLTATSQAMWSATETGVLPARAWASLSVLLAGYSIGVALAFLLAVIAVTTRIGSDLLETLTSMLNPLPAIALLPLAMLWFGLGSQSLIFVLLHAVLWPVALNAHSGFRAVPATLRMVGRNYDLTGINFVTRILLPAAFPSILAGLKIGWAFAWRTLIAAELVFGVSNGSGGLGWYIFENKNLIQIPEVFAGLLTVILIGLAVENLVFRTVERNTVHRWGMQH